MQNLHSEVTTQQDDFLAAAANNTEKLTKDDISKPFKFHHITHVGFDPVSGFYISDDESDNKEFDEFLKTTYMQSQNKHAKEFVCAKLKSKLTKDDISEPFTFQHTEHLGRRDFVCDEKCAHKAAITIKTKTDKGQEIKES